MHRKPVRAPWVSIFIILITAFVPFIRATDSTIRYDEATHDQSHAKYAMGIAEAPSLVDTGGLADMQSQVRRALVDIAGANKARVERRQPLKIAHASHHASKSSTGISGHSPERRSVDSTLASQDERFLVTADLANAAKYVAESTPQRPSGDHEEIAARIQARYAQETPNGPDTGSAAASDSFLNGFGIESERKFTSKRESDEFWFADIERREFAPYAPSGYDVWRDVKAFGAKGDGVTDDTDAINRAMSEGLRCGAECGSGSATPAVVYFPPGVYLVSRPIIQYYNTQIVGNPHQIPTIVAATSFIGLGVITSNVYTDDNEEWYSNQSNFLRSIKNLKIDIRLADPSAYVCGIHWQVAQGTSLENIQFFMLTNTEAPDNTQQGIYMENGSGGWLADLTFVGGNFGAYLGAQQFTTSRLTFVNCQTALRVHWNWAWTLHGIVVENCTNGLTLASTPGGSNGTDQGVGSIVLVDSVIKNTETGILTAASQTSSPSILLQNVGFFNVSDAVLDLTLHKVLLPGGQYHYADSWGLGRVSDGKGQTSFIDGQELAALNRSKVLLQPSAMDQMKPFLFTRRRPDYSNVPSSQIIDVKAFGAKGDGETDDTVVLNSILRQAANSTSIVYFPFGVYLIKDTLRVPIGSRVIGQAWSQIMASGPLFEDESKPRVAMQMGRVGDVGVLEVQDMMFTVSGPTAGAIVVEWNAHESHQGSVGMWDTHIRIGGAHGSKLQSDKCPQRPGKVHPDCKAASLLLHMTPSSTGYLENVWAWVADHDLELSMRDKIDVYAGRGILIQSQKAWLWGTASEHALMYQYQLSEAKNIFMGMIQTDSPYFQPSQSALQSFRAGNFPQDPTFADCAKNDAKCLASWAIRVLDSSTVYILGGGFYSWFSDNKQECVDANDCQTRGFGVEASSDLWVYNMCTKAIGEILSPLNEVPTYAKDNINGYLSSLLAWLPGTETPTGNRSFEGFRAYGAAEVKALPVPESCKAALRRPVYCHEKVQEWKTTKYHGSLFDLTDQVCDPGCATSLQNYYDAVDAACAGRDIHGAIPTLRAGHLWAGFNETCLRSEDGEQYCNDVIREFKRHDSIEDMPTSELCSFCYVERRAMMQRSPYSIYNSHYKQQLEHIYAHCNASGPTTYPPSPKPSSNAAATAAAAKTLFCPTNKTTTTTKPETCDSLSLTHNLSSASLYTANAPTLHSCALPIPPNTTLCLPPPCAKTHLLTQNDSCASLAATHHSRTSHLLFSDFLPTYNPHLALQPSCDANLHASRPTYGSVLCLAPQGGAHSASSRFPFDTAVPRRVGKYSREWALPPAGCEVAEGTRRDSCGLWLEAREGDSCARLAVEGGISGRVLAGANPSLEGGVGGCDGRLEVGKAYCVWPMDDDAGEGEDEDDGDVGMVSES